MKISNNLLGIPLLTAPRNEVVIIQKSPLKIVNHSVIYQISLSQHHGNITSEGVQLSVGNFALATLPFYMNSYVRRRVIYYDLFIYENGYDRTRTVIVEVMCIYTVIMYKRCLNINLAYSFLGYGEVGVVK